MLGGIDEHAQTHAFFHAVEIAAARRFEMRENIDCAQTRGALRMFHAEIFADAADILRDELGYDCRRLPLEECEERAEELARKFAAYRDRVLAEAGAVTRDPGSAA